MEIRTKDGTHEEVLRSSQNTGDLDDPAGEESPVGRGSKLEHVFIENPTTELSGGTKMRDL